MKEKIYQVNGDDMIINWKKLNDSKILNKEELIIIYMLLDKVKNTERGEK